MVKLNKELKIVEEYKESIEYLTDKMKIAGYEFYIVGGSVRDMLLGEEVYDYDFTTNAKPEQVIKIFPHVVPTGIKHGTVTVIHKKQHFEITTYRCDGKYGDGRHPESITYSETLEEDVSRRDFTINGLAYDPLKKEVIDYCDGLKDLEKGVIQTIGNASDRLSEDGLRAYRACRFAAKLNFSIQENVLKAISDTLTVSEKISVERIREEIMKMMLSEKPSIALEYMRETGLMKLCLPELLEGYGLSQNKYHKYDIYYHGIYSCDGGDPQNPLIRFAALLHDIGKVPTRRSSVDGNNTFYNHEIVGARMVKRIMKRLKFSNEDISKAINLVENHMFHYTDDWSDGAVRRFMRKVGVENLDDLIKLRMADRKGNGTKEGFPHAIRVLQRRIAKIIEEENAITVKDLAVNGNDVMKHFNIKPGPVIGIVLNELLERVLDDPEFNERENLFSYAEEIFHDAQLKSDEKQKHKPGNVQ